MTLTLQEVSIVVVARNNAPGALHPEFLRRSGIVDVEWGVPATTPAISTDMLSQVRYANGVTLLSTPDRITVSQAATPTGDGGAVPSVISADLVAGVAARYIGALPFLQVAAVGVNAVAIQQLSGTQSPSAFLSDRFIVDGPWKTVRGVPVRPSVRLGYAWPSGGSLTLTLDEGTLQGADGASVQVLVVSANLHRDTGAMPGREGTVGPATVEQVLPMIAGAAGDIADFVALASDDVLTQEQAAR